LNSFYFQRYQRHKYHLTDHLKTNGSPGHFIGRMIKGSAKLKSRNKTITVSEGDIFYIPNGLKYQSYWYGDAENKILFDSFRFYYFPMLDNYSYTLQKIDCSPSAKEILLELSREMAVNCSTVGKLYLFLGEVVSGMEQKSKRYNDIAEIALEYMHTHTDFLISDVAQHCKVSESTLYSVFKKAYQATPVEKKQEIFCVRATELLTTTDLPVEEISEMLNFSSSSYFRKIFKKHTGKTPLQVRKTTKNRI
jgi:AraC-like DNA-binding protein